jgi:hypothetical protein
MAIYSESGTFISTFERSKIDDLAVFPKDSVQLPHAEYRVYGFGF